MKNRKCFEKTICLAVMAGGLLLQGTTVLADAPLDELEEIMEHQNESATGSLLKQTLGLEELQKTMEEQGLDVQLKVAVDDRTAGLEDSVPEDGYVSVGLQVNLAQKAWAFTAGAGTQEGSILDASLYGDPDLLALSMPQFYEGALAIGPGNLKEQYEASELYQMLEETNDLLDIDLKFYPEEEDLEAGDDFQEELEDIAETRRDLLLDAMQVEKTEDDDTTIYQITLSGEDVVDFYSGLLKDYYSSLEHTGLLTVTEVSDDYEAQMDELTTQLAAAISDEVTIEFLVSDQLVQEIRCDLPIDTTQLETAPETISEEETELENSGTAETAESVIGSEAEDGSRIIGGADGATEIELESGEFTGVISCDLVYWDPSDVGQGFYLNIAVVDDTEQEIAGCYMDWSTVTNTASQSRMLYLELREDGETIYEGTPFFSSFDQESGDYYVTIDLTDENGVYFALDLYSDFSEICQGSSFVWTIEELSVQSEEACAGITAEIQISANPAEIEKPQNVRMILELSQEELMNLVQEVSINAALWSGQFETETE